MIDKKEDRYFMASVKLGPKGQIVIPKEVREMFGVAPGDTMVLLADRKKGVALQTVDKLNPMLRKTFRSIVNDEEGDGEEDEA
ncbi:MAG: AbrB/MazE/SpoVT family DNA-binding domain-containing protein [Oscillospiraceae bacterium]|mgnify:CR=1 FL=1|nr:AbrB/MazE/SpoVT family DNA-binding domain-containing protein [Oscillospiraceae bacterium]